MANVSLDDFFGAECRPVSDAQRAELDRRLEAYERDPNAGVSWESLKHSLENK